MTEPGSPARGEVALGRRAFLAGMGAGAGWLLARGLGVPGLVARDAGSRPVAETLRALGASLTPMQRELVVFPADHPSRQVANTISVLERPHLGTLLSPAQRALVDELYLAMLSPRGRGDFAGTVAVEGRLDGCVLAIYGEPASGRAQAVIMGGHLLLRGGGERRDGAAFGGGIAYGHQIGNHRFRVEGNSFAYHGDAANRLFASLAPEERGQAILPAPPHELVLQVQGAGAAFPGVRVGSLSEEARDRAAGLVGAVFGCFPDAERAHASECLAANGGVDALHVATYASRGFYSDMAAYGDLDPAERARRGDPYWQVWRLEGPGAIVHFQGHPHVHAYVRIVRDPARANLGESLGETASAIDGEAMRRLLEGALRRASGEALAFHGADVPGRFCPGEITTGLAWSLDPYRNRVAVATIEGRAMAEPLRERLRAAGVAIEPERSYRVATASWYAGAPDVFGEPERVELASALLREALVDHLRAGGLADAAV